jgi:hypothetical protein
VEPFQEVDGVTDWRDGEYLDVWWGPLIQDNADCAVYVDL